MCKVVEENTPNALQRTNELIADAVDAESLESQLRQQLTGHDFDQSALVHDEHRRLLAAHLQRSAGGADGTYESLYHQNVAALRFQSEIGKPLSQEIVSTIEYLSMQLLRAELECADGRSDMQKVRGLLDEAVELGLRVDKQASGLWLQRVMGRWLQEIHDGSTDAETFERLLAALKLANSHALEVDLWETQTAVFELLHSTRRNPQLEQLAAAARVRLPS